MSSKPPLPLQLTAFDETGSLRRTAAVDWINEPYEAIQALTCKGWTAAEVEFVLEWLLSYFRPLACAKADQDKTSTRATLEKTGNDGYAVVLSTADDGQEDDGQEIDRILFPLLPGTKTFSRLPTLRRRIEADAKRLVRALNEPVAWRSRVEIGILPSPHAPTPRAGRLIRRLSAEVDRWPATRPLRRCQSRRCIAPPRFFFARTSEVACPYCRARWSVATRSRDSRRLTKSVLKNRFGDMRWRHELITRGRRPKKTRPSADLLIKALEGSVRAYRAGEITETEMIAAGKSAMTRGALRREVMNLVARTDIPLTDLD